MLRVVKVRLYPTSKQKMLLLKTFGSCRFVYNLMLDKKIETYRKDKTSLSTFSLINELPILKKENFDWLKEVDSTSLQQSIKNMDKAYQGFFKGGDFPKFKSRHQLTQSYQTTNAKIVDNNSIKLPKHNGKEVGLDIGVKKLATLSDGTEFRRLHLL